MITISLCMIVKNEALRLARCLDSIKTAVDEIIILDTGSTDQTKSVALAYTEKVYDFPWTNDFAAARNASYAKATMDYQMWLDADDVLPEESLHKLLALKKTLDPSYEMVTMNYLTHFDAHGTPTLTCTRERLSKREKNYQWTDPVHECIPLTGSVYDSDIKIYHMKGLDGQREPSERNLAIYLDLENKQPLSPRQQYYFARELKDHSYWEKAVHYFESFLAGGKGWGEDNIAACYHLSLCYNVLKEEDKILPVLLKSFLFDSPRAEICSEIGYFYQRQQNYPTALKWFDLATKLEKPESMGFVLWDYWGYIPNIECCVCCSQLGEYAKALKYNEQAAVYKPYAQAVKLNRQILALQLRD